MRYRLALLFCLAAIAGCGESDEEQFRDDFDPINDRLADLGDEIGQALRQAENKSDDELARQFDGFASEIATIGEDVEELDPPEDLSDELDRLEDSLADVEGSLTEIADASEKGDARAARRATLQLIEQGSELDELQRQLLDG